jgi:predicted HTH domain antitoxin
MEMNSPDKKKLPIFYTLFILGFAFLSIGSLWGQIFQEKTFNVDPQIWSNFKNNPITCFISVFSQFLGINLFNWLLLVMGYSLRKNYHAKFGNFIVYLAWGLIFSYGLILIFPQTVFSPKKINSEMNLSQDKGLRIFEEGCEFSVIFPHKFKKREGWVGELKSHVFETKEAESNVYLRAEFLPLNDSKLVGEINKNFKKTLENFAHLSNISIPEITIENSSQGKIGTFSGVKLSDGIELKNYGKVFLGKVSMLITLSVEPLKESLSKESIKFFSSVERV